MTELGLSLPCEETAKDGHLQARSRVFTGNQISSTLLLDFIASSTVRDKGLLITPPSLCYPVAAA